MKTIIGKDFFNTITFHNEYLQSREIIMEDKHSNIKHRNNLHNDQAERYVENLKYYMERFSKLQRFYEYIIREKGSWYHKFLLKTSIKYKTFKWLIIFIPIKILHKINVNFQSKMGIKYKEIEYWL